MNPEKMRTEYGKLVYLLQDSCLPHVRELLEFDCVRPVKTVRAWRILPLRRQCTSIVQIVGGCACHDLHSRCNG